MIRGALRFQASYFFRVAAKETAVSLTISSLETSRAMAAPNKKRAASITDISWTDQRLGKRQHLPKTCEWILREPIYKAWKDWEDTSSPILWIHGPPGCGKSYLAQYIVKDLKAAEDESAVLSHFCDASSTPASVLRSVLAQLLLHPRAERDLKEQITETVEQLSPDSHSAPLDPTYRLWDKVIKIVEGAPPITLVIDGLDELPSKYLLPAEFDFPSRLMELTAVMAGYIRLLVLSRTEASIRNAFKDSREIQITPSRVRDDAEIFISSEVSKHANLVPLKDKIVDALLSQSEGIFLWAALAVKTLAQEPTGKFLEKLENLPASLDDLYASIFEHQSAELGDGEILLRDSILRLMLFAVRPLRVIEIANALSVESNVFIPDLEAKSIEVCGSLVKIGDGILRPMHHSLRDFLLGEHSALQRIVGIKPSIGNLFISKTLLHYLAHSKFGRISEPLDSDNFHSTHPLAEYATLYWAYHASQAVSDPSLQAQIRSFFNQDNAKEWADRLLPLFLHRSVLPVPPRPFNTARFFHLFSLKSQIVNYFDSKQKTEVDEQISNYLRSTYEEILESARTQDGSESLSVLKRLLDLAEVYSWLPSHQKHVPTVLEEALRISSQLSSPEAQDLAVAAHQALADEHKRNGKYEDAQKLLDKLLYLAHDRIPPNDPKMMFALDSLGWACMRRGQLEPAAKHLQDALDIATERYGSHSPMTLRSKVTLAEVLGKLGRGEDAEALCASLKEQLRRHRENSVALPKDSISHLNTLAAIYMQEGKYDEAKEMYKVVVEDRRKLFGEEHRLTLWAEMQWGIAMDKGGDTEAARETFESLVTRQEKVLGSGHPDVKEVKGRLGLS